MDEQEPFPEQKPVIDVSVVTSMFGDQITKQSIKDVAINVIKPLISGDIGNCLQTYIHAKVLSEYISEIVDRVKPLALDEANNYPKGDTMNNVGFSVVTSAKRYTYDHDKVWSDLNDKLTEIKAKMKDREDLMKKAIDFGGAADDDGVEIPPAKLKSGGTESIKITIPRDINQ